MIPVLVYMLRGGQATYLDTCVSVRHGVLFASMVRQLTGWPAWVTGAARSWQ